MQILESTQYTSVADNTKLLAIMAKSAYLKDSDNKASFNTALDCLNYWKDIYQNFDTDWDILKLSGNNPDGSYSLLGGFNAVSYKDGNEIVNKES